MDTATNTAELLSALAKLADLLRAVGESHWGAWATTMADRIRRGDGAAIDTLLGAYGGMGSLNDLVLCKMNGHDVPPDREAALNDELTELQSTVWALARQIRRRRG